jgi:hypothetical protein
VATIVVVLFVGYGGQRTRKGKAMTESGSKMVNIQFARTIIITYYEDVIVKVPCGVSTEDIHDLVDGDLYCKPWCQYVDLDDPSDSVYSDEDDDSGPSIVDVTEMDQKDALQPDVTLIRNGDGELVVGDSDDPHAGEG